MAYLFRQKLYLKDLAGLSAPPKKILISEPESYLSALYGHYLEAHNFDIKHCPRLDQIKAALANFSPTCFWLMPTAGASSICWELTLSPSFPVCLS